MINKNLPPVEFKQDSFNVTSPEHVEESRYAIFYPSIDTVLSDGRSIISNTQQIHDAIKGFSEALVAAGENPDIDRGYEITNLEDALDGDYLTDSKLSIDDTEVQVPSELGELITSFATIAHDCGFDPKKASFRVMFGLVNPESDPNRIFHSDGMGRSSPKGAKNVSAKRLRFVYSPDSGTLVYPDPDNRLKAEEFTANPLGDGSDAEKIHEVNEDDLVLGYAKRSQLNKDDELLVDAQQVVPGAVLAFDPSRILWHQSPESDGTRLTVVVDVDYMDHDAPVEKYA